MFIWVLFLLYIRGRAKSSWSDTNLGITVEQNSDNKRIQVLLALEEK